MKKAVALILLLLCAFIFVGCGAEKLNGKTEVYTFSGENDDFSVSNGTVFFCASTFNGQICRI